MKLAFLDQGSADITLILIVLIAFIITVGNYGKNTALGYRGSVLLSLLSSPLLAFIIIRIIKSRSKQMSS
jgi:ABC-type transport system involved in multi-copper enzyme maturation permease subunit